MHQLVKEIVGAITTLLTITVGVVSWLQVLQGFAQLALTVAGIVAAWHAGHFWKEKRIIQAEARASKKSCEEETTTV